MKWKGLLKTYKDIPRHNNTSGNEKNHWEFFCTLHNILHKRPEITPVATCSSYKGLIRKTPPLKTLIQKTKESVAEQQDPIHL